MSSYAVCAELDVHVASTDEYRAVVRRWLDDGSRLLLPDVRAELDREDLPSVEPESGDDPFGPPGAAWGRFHVATEREGRTPSSAARPVTTKTWTWLDRQLASPKRRALVSLRRLGDTGRDVATAIQLQARADSDYPGWVQLVAGRTSTGFVAEQERWLAFLRGYAEDMNPVYGQIGVLHNWRETTLEKSLPVDYGRNTPPHTVSESRQWLRGYTWVTILAQELADRLGGVAALTDTGAFAEVAQLKNSGVWLRSTADFADYDQAAAERSFHVLAPVIRPGQPQPQAVDPRTGRPRDERTPHLIVYEDAATHREPEGH